jgi:hypothetical protein
MPDAESGGLGFSRPLGFATKFKETCFHDPVKLLFRIESDIARLISKTRSSKEMFDGGEVT